MPTWDSGTTAGTMPSTYVGTLFNQTPTIGSYLTSPLYVRVYCTGGATRWPTINVPLTQTCTDATNYYFYMSAPSADFERFTPRAPAIVRAELLNRPLGELLRDAREQQASHQQALHRPVYGQRSEEERAALAERYAREAEQRAKERAEADAKAHKILLRFLTAEQRRDFEASKEFLVIGASGAKYRIKWGRVANIEALTADDRVSHRLCVHPVDASLPIEDVLLAQLLHLKSNDNDLARIANRHP